MAAPAPAPARKGGGNVFTRRLGPLPAWAWMAIAAGVVLLIVGYEYYKKSKASSPDSSTASADVTPPVVEQFELTTPPTAPVPAKGGPIKTPGPPPKKGQREVTVGGPHATKDLDQLAKQYGITEAELVKLNPHLKRYEGSGKPIPKRTKIKV